MERIGFACAYTPLPLLDAAGFTPYRLLPHGDWPDRAGSILHDNLCPHVKRILDRGMAGDVPRLAGTVIVLSCDAMRRLADGWQRVRPEDRVFCLDLPATTEKGSVEFYGHEIAGLADALAQWSGRAVALEAIEESVRRYTQLAGGIERVAERLRSGTLRGGSARLQALYNRAVTEPVLEAIAMLDELAEQPKEDTCKDDGVPILLFGNVAPDPEVFTLIESCGARIVADDLRTGARIHAPLELDGPGDVFVRLARAMLHRPPCARTFTPSRPGDLAALTLAAAKTAEVRGTIGYTVKFCDPYLARLPAVREAFRDAGLPLLLLEGDCTMGSIGQQRTRIEAFVEMLR